MVGGAAAGGAAGDGQARRAKEGRCGRRAPSLLVAWRHLERLVHFGTPAPIATVISLVIWWRWSSIVLWQMRGKERGVVAGSCGSESHGSWSGLR